MERRVLLAIFLAFLTLYLWQALVMPPPKPATADAPAETVVEQLHKVQSAAQSLGCTLAHPFMTLSFMSLSVIGDLKLTDRGLVDVAAFKHVELFP